MLVFILSWRIGDINIYSFRLDTLSYLIIFFTNKILIFYFQLHRYYLSQIDSPDLTVI
jgi:cytochrome b subunit of formate dehydrogenase